MFAVFFFFFSELQYLPSLLLASPDIVAVLEKEKNKAEEREE